MWFYHVVSPDSLRVSTCFNVPNHPISEVKKLLVADLSKRFGNLKAGTWPSVDVPWPSVAGVAGARGVCWDRDRNPFSAQPTATRIIYKCG